MTTFGKLLSLMIAFALTVSLCACGLLDPQDGSGAEAPSGDVSHASDGTNESPAAGPSEPEQTPPPAAEKPYAVADSLKTAGVGDVVLFGSYEQNGKDDDGKEPVEWLVLDKNGSSLLLISLYALDSGVFHDEREYVCWDGSTMRAWLNGAFLNGTFSSEERSAIRNTVVTAEASPEYPNVPAGSDTEDKIFLLSIREAERYFAGDAARACSPTEGMVAAGGFTRSNKPWYASHDYACLWWLRSPGMDKLKIAYVDKGGKISFGGNQIDYDNKTCIRPALWVTAE